ncbi:MAG TPA: hypothetical protein PK079_25075 [Leptospiraceae bacterium]|nr:hypothetical protein [Leptospiraceae bacterium]HMW08595.1 hypothetical protein [Leptospiraceae bacterium]HMZ66554.1 hypothetical protein [Leptospiraceae bacterium]HNA10226.1 hypothetical protein [Leptospiraceae bacterium]HNB98558.1 hypothetical protein [Leptospiraceae bacterium]
MSAKIVDTNNMGEIISGLEELSSRSVDVGILGNADSKLLIYANANEFGAVIKSRKAMRKLFAMMRELGIKPDKSKRKNQNGIVIPERSFFRSAVDNPANVDKMVKLAEFALNRFFSGQGKAIDVLNAAASSMVASIKNNIASGIDPANSDFTFKKKGHAKTLLGKNPHLIKAVTYEVK